MSRSVRASDMSGQQQKIVIKCKELDDVTLRESICAALRERLKLSGIEEGTRVSKEDEEDVWEYTNRYF